MKLFAYQPNGHGECSFFTMAENKEIAFQNIKRYIEYECPLSDNCKFCKEYVNIEDESYYTMYELNENEVITNDND